MLLTAIGLADRTPAMVGLNMMPRSYVNTGNVVNEFVDSRGQNISGHSGLHSYREASSLRSPPKKTPVVWNHCNPLKGRSLGLFRAQLSLSQLTPPAPQMLSCQQKLLDRGRGLGRCATFDLEVIKKKQSDEQSRKR